MIGDVGKFRSALAAAGFGEQKDCSIFNDRRLRSGFRRLKLWFANSVFYAQQSQQWALKEHLEKEFGDRILSMYFIESCNRYPTSDNKSLCIRLKV